MTRCAPTRVLPLVAAVLCARGEIIDRIAVSVGNRVIMQSDLERQIRVTAFQNGTKPDFSAANRRAVVDKMIEQKLVQRELETSRYPQPSAEDVVPAIEQFRKAHYPDDASWKRALAEYQITEKDLLDVLLWERTLLDFVELRFESGVLVSEQEVAELARQKGLSTADAERSLIASRADEQLDQWLRDARRRTPVIMHQEVFQ